MKSFLSEPTAYLIVWIPFPHCADYFCAVPDDLSVTIFVHKQSIHFAPRCEKEDV